MAYYRATYLCPSSTGLVTLSSLPFTPTHAKFTLGGKTTNSTTEARHSEGWADGNGQNATAILVNSHGNYSREYSSSCLVALSTPGGTITEEVLASLDSFPTNACKLNFSASTNTFAYTAEFWDD